LAAEAEERKLAAEAEERRVTAAAETEEQRAAAEAKEKKALQEFELERMRLELEAKRLDAENRGTTPGRIMPARVKSLDLPSFIDGIAIYCGLRDMLPSQSGRNLGYSA